MAHLLQLNIPLTLKTNNMTPKEKAKDLIATFAEALPHKSFGVIIERDWETAKQCAMIAINERIEEMHSLLPQIGDSWEVKKVEYLNKVRNEIEKF